MSKLPFMQFYPADWLQDTRTLSLAARGLWIDLCCALWTAPDRGRLTWTWPMFVKFVGYPEETGYMNEDSYAIELLEELANSHVADITETPKDDNNDHSVTIVSRRMVKEEMQRKQARDRQSRKRHGPVTQESRRIYQKSEVRSHISEKSKRGSQYPEDFQVSDEVKAWAKANYLPDPTTELQAFKDYHQAKGSTFKDWDAALRTWMRNGKRFNGNGKGKPDLPFSQVPKAPTYKPKPTERRADPEMLTKLRELTGNIGKV